MFTSTLLRFLILQTFVAVALCGCYCLNMTQDMDFCESDYVLKVKVLQKMKIPADYTYWGEAGPVKILEIFKGYVPDLDLIGGKVVTLGMSYDCPAHMDAGKDYIIFGFIRNDKIHISGCGENKLWSDLTPDELQHLENRYSKYCTPPSYRHRS